jgi:phosphate transport system substrate-binding protein
MPHSSIKRLAAGSCILAVLATASFAEDVTLTTTDGTFSLVGELTAINDDTLTIRTKAGTMTVGRDTVTCIGADCPEGMAAVREITIAGDRAMGTGIIPDLMRAYAQGLGAEVRTLKTVDDSIRIELTGGSLAENSAFKLVTSTSSDGISALLDGAADIALSDRRSQTREARAATELELGNLRSAEQEQIIALDGLVFVTHPGNPVRAITQGDAALIYAGLLTNWSELGGKDAPIKAYVSTRDLGSTEIFDAMVMRPAGLTVNPSLSVLGSDRLVAKAVSEDENAVGFTRFSNIGAARPLAIKGDCGIQVLPSEFAIKTEEYPLTRQLYMYRTNKELAPLASEFATYLRSDAAQAALKEAGFVDQTITNATIDQQGLRLASAMTLATDPAEQTQLRSMMDSLLNAERLSTTFRFETGTADLNARSAADVDRLAGLIEAGQFANKELIFLGFTDSVGDGELNRQLSQQRAEQLIEIMIAKYPDLAGKVKLTAAGYGEVSPVACNELDQGRAINRRIEVWVRDLAG